ncbi:MAG: hypothetical protein M1828_005675 [Chrysothrix sp. TS-e1954]|nr:MAG: hypothetical protein M1828_005675 [Chrysothrix sp. TS-e1954]
MLSAAVRKNLHYWDATALIKIWLRIALSLCDFVAFFLFIAAIVQANLTGFYFGFLVPLGLSAMWSFLWVFRTISQQKPPHPGWAVGLDLLILTALGWADTIGAFASDAAASAVASEIFASIASLLTIIVWIWACVDCARYNKQKKRGGLGKLPRDNDTEQPGFDERVEVRAQEIARERMERDDRADTPSSDSAGLELSAPSSLRKSAFEPVQRSVDYDLNRFNLEGRGPSSSIRTAAPPYEL